MLDCASQSQEPYLPDLSGVGIGGRWFLGKAWNALEGILTKSLPQPPFAVHKWSLNTFANDGMLTVQYPPCIDVGIIINCCYESTQVLLQLLYAWFYESSVWYYVVWCTTVGKQDCCWGLSLSKEFVSREHSLSPSVFFYSKSFSPFYYEIEIVREENNFDHRSMLWLPLMTSLSWRAFSWSQNH